MDMNAEFVAMMERQLKRWDAELARYQAQIRDLRVNRRAACRTLQRVRDAISRTP
jgi:hypothetical protein